MDIVISEKSSIEIETITSFPPNANPFAYDGMRMGTAFGKDLMLMHIHHPHEDVRGIVFVNTRTGERFVLYLRKFMHYE